jgi:homogentisate 1,2-dioxygenase
VDSDEVLYYVHGDFMSRTGVQEGSITLHPMGIPHGPQPGKTEASIGKKETEEYAVMIDTFQPLYVTKNVKETMVEEYSQSWLPKK